MFLICQLVFILYRLYKSEAGILLKEHPPPVLPNVGWNLQPLGFLFHVQC